MSKTTKSAAIGAAFLFAIGAYAWSAISVYVTLAGSEERELVSGDLIEYIRLFGWYLVGPELPAASIAFWLGAVATVMAFAFSTRPRKP